MDSITQSTQVEQVNEKGRRGKMRWPLMTLYIPASIIGFAMLVPIVYLIIRAFGGSEGIAEILIRQRTLDIVLRSALLVVTTTAASILIAVPIAWLTVRTDLPLRRMWSVLTILPLVVPSYLYAGLLISGLGKKGMLQGFLEAPFGIMELPNIKGFPGALIALTLISFPYVLLTVRAALWRIDPSLEEAAHGLGQSKFQAFIRVTLPLLAPAIAAGGLLVALYTLSDFGAVSLMNYETFTWAIYGLYGSPWSRHVGAALSLVLIAIAVIVLLLEARSRKRSRYYRTHSGSEAPPAIVKLGKWRWPAMFLCGGIVALTFLVPVSILIYWLVRGVTLGEPLLLLWGPMFNSLLVSAIAALVAVIAAIPIAVLAVRQRHWITGLLERVSYMGFAMPGIAVALALVFLSVRTPLYQTLFIMIFAYVILFLPTAIGAIRTSLLQINPAMEEAARGMGRSPLYVFFRVHLPLIKTGVLAGAALVFLLVMKELPATMILSPTGFKTLATSIWSASEEAFFARTAAPALFLIGVSSLSIALLMKRERWT